MQSTGKLVSRIKSLTAGLLALVLVGAASNTLATPVQWSGNSHWYDAITGQLTWTQANAAAQASGGYLATTTSLAENTFVYNHALSHPAVFESTGFQHGPWLGGFDSCVLGSCEPAGVWAWVTGEAWSFTRWDSGEPNDAGPTGVEDHLHFHGKGSSVTGGWNDVDVSGSNVVFGYMVEWNTDPSTIGAPEPTTLLLLSLGLAGIGFRKRKA